MIAVSVPLIRKNHILYKLRQCKAYSPLSAVTLEDAGVKNPKGFSRITEWLVRKNVIFMTWDGRYYTR